MAKRKRVAETAGRSGPAAKKMSAWKAGSAGSSSRKAQNTRTGGFQGIELKFLDTAWNSVAISAAGSTTAAGCELQPSTGCTDAISVPAQGDGESQRDGRRYAIKSAWVSGVIRTVAQSDQADTAPVSGLYFALVLDTQANGSTVNSEDVFTNPTTAGFGMLKSPLRNLQNSRRFRILDSQYVPPTGAYSGHDAAATVSISYQSSPEVNLSWKGNIVCDSTGTTANIASASDNAIHVVAFAGDTLYTPTFFGKGRVRFVG